MAFSNGWRGPDIVADGLVLYLDAGSPNSYRTGFGTTWKDISGFGYNGTLTNGPTFSSANGGSFVFDGTDDYAQFTNPSNLQAQNLTISLWVNPASATNVITSLIDYDHASLPVQGWVIQSEDATSNRYYYFAYYDGTKYEPATGIGAGKGVQLTNSTWQNLTFTKSGTSVLGYLNGTQTFTSTAGNATISYLPSRNLRIANVISTASGVGNRSYNGQVSTTQIYNKALSASEVLQNYNATKTRFGL
jgi:hypothetical protein